jgi:nitroalkane oxidase
MGRRYVEIASLSSIHMSPGGRLTVSLSSGQPTVQVGTENGATLSLLAVRYSEDSGPEKANVNPADNVMILAVDRAVVAANDPSAYQFLSEPELMGVTATTNPHTRYTNFRVPAANVVMAPGIASPIIAQAFGVTAPLVSAQALETMRTAYNKALQFAKTDHRGGIVPIIQRQSVADILIDVKMKIDATRLLIWKALDSLDDSGSADAEAVFESCLAAKIYGTDCAVPAVFDAMRVVGM